MAIVGKNFRKLKRQACKASVAIEGLSGSGKSGIALTLGYILSGKDWKGVYALDTENESLNLYGDLKLITGDIVTEDCNVYPLSEEEGYQPTNYDAVRKLAIKEGAKAFIMDSASHMWQYKGGVLDLVTQVTAELNNKDKYAAWGDPRVVLEKNKILDLFRSSKVHTIATIRVKEKMEYVEGDEGKKKLQSLGEQQLQMPDLKYEPDLVLHAISPADLDKNVPAKIRVIKSRYAILKKDEEYSLTPELLEQLRQYLEEGTSPEELLELQRQDYVSALEEHLDKYPSARAIWNVLKENNGYKDYKLADIPLQGLKILFSKLVTN